MGQLKAFISYCHEDESKKDELVKFLHTLERAGVLTHWHDRKLLAGDKFDLEIKNNIENSDLVILLLSQDFLASYYCYEVELEAALRRVEAGRARVVSIVLDHCTWKDTPLKDFVVLPTDAVPLSDYVNSSKAWTKIIEDIKNICKDIKEKNELDSPESPFMIIEFKADFLSYLLSNELTLQHRQKENVDLDDIYIDPDLKLFHEEIDVVDRIVSSTKITHYSSCPDKVLIIGDEQSGKTSLAKKIIKNNFADGKMPVLIKGGEVNTTDISALIDNAKSRQYAAKNFEPEVLVIEDIELSRLNTKHLLVLIKNANARKEKIIFISGKNVQFNEAVWRELSDCTCYEILPFGHVLRGEIINKWNSLGQEMTIDASVLHAANDKVTHHVNALLRKNIVPPKPVFILMILQTLETSVPSDFSLTAYGHCYNALIQQSLRKSKIKNDLFDKYINYLTEFSYFLFKTNKPHVSDEDILLFTSEYSTRYLIESHEKAIDDLCSTGLLKKDYNGLSFSYKYIYYFYAAKYIAENYRVEPEIIDQLCAKLHSEKHANILIFVTYHTKDQDVIDKILHTASSIFSEESPATLTASDTEHFEELLETIPALVMESVTGQDVEEKRKESLTRKDIAARLVEDEQEIQEENDIIETHTFADINRSAKAVEIIGQILRNRHGSLRLDQLDSLSKTSFSAGLRFLSFYFKLTKSAKGEILDEVSKVIEKNSSLTESEVKDVARKIFHGICYGVSFAVIKKVSFSTGNDQLIPVFKKIAAEIDTPAVHLISICIELEFTKRVNKESIETALRKVGKQTIAYRLLQEVVMQHLYVHTIEYNDRQWLSSKLNIPMHNQRLAQSQKRTKLLEN